VRAAALLLAAAGSLAVPGALTAQEARPAPEATPVAPAPAIRSASIAPPDGPASIAPSPSWSAPRTRTAAGARRRARRRWRWSFAVETHYAWSVAAHGLATMALLRAEETAGARRQALDKAVRWLCNCRMTQRGSNWDNDAVWGWLYGTSPARRSRRTFGSRPTIGAARSPTAAVSSSAGWPRTRSRSAASATTTTRRTRAGRSGGPASRPRRWCRLSTGPAARLDRRRGDPRTRGRLRAEAAGCRTAPTPTT
jgi:hypothetical protein